MRDDVIVRLAEALKAARTNSEYYVVMRQIEARLKVVGFGK